MSDKNSKEIDAQWMEYDAHYKEDCEEIKSKLEKYIIKLKTENNKLRELLATIKRTKIEF